MTDAKMEMMVSRATYPGRACLLGEHCDWAGGASLAVPLPMGVQAEARPAAQSAARGVSIRTVLHGVPEEGWWERTGRVEPDGGPLRFVPAALHRLAAIGLDVPPTEIRVTSDLPTGRGFSSSAAFTLTVLDVLIQRAGRTREPHALAQLAYEVEHDLLGVECGLLDPLACAARAPVFIRWEVGGYAVRRTEPGAAFHLVAVALPAPRDTKAILGALNAHFFGTTAERGAAGSAVREAIEVFGDAAVLGAEALEAGAPTALGRAMNEAQSAYERLLDPELPELRAPAVSRICATLREQGALGAKFSGAGGESSVIALFPDDATARAATDGLVDSVGALAFQFTIGDQDDSDQEGSTDC